MNSVALVAALEIDGEAGVAAIYSSFDSMRAASSSTGS